MTWTAQIAKLNTMGTGVAADVALARDADKPFTQCFQTDGTMANLQNQVRSYVMSRDASTGKSELAVGQIVDLTPPPPPQPPSDALVAEQTFLANWRTYQSYLRGIEASFIDPQNKVVTELSATLASTLLPEYWSLL